MLHLQSGSNERNGSPRWLLPFPLHIQSQTENALRNSRGPQSNQVSKYQPLALTFSLSSFKELTVFSIYSQQDAGWSKCLLSPSLTT